MAKELNPATVVGLLAEPERLKVVAAIVLGAGDPAEIATATGLDERAIGRAVQRLHRAGALSIADHRFRIDADVFKRVARAAAPIKEDTENARPDVAAVWRAFFDDGRLVSIPVQQAKRRIVLERIAMVFEPGVRYPEREVDAMLRAFHPDYAMLRRNLVDEAFLSRARGEYWRSGGWVEVAG